MLEGIFIEIFLRNGNGLSSLFIDSVKFENLTMKEGETADSTSING